MFDRIAEAYQGASVVVIGAGGIGGEIIRLVSGRASRIIAADHSSATLQQLSSIVAPDKLVARQLDVRDPVGVGEFARFVRDTVGCPRFVFYSAGILTIEPFVETLPQDWQRVVDVNLNGAFYCTKALAELMVPQRCGSILLLGSIAGTKARSGSRVNPVYNATKAGLAAFVNSTAMQLRPHGVRINCISPGPTATSMMDIQPAQVHVALRDVTLDGRQNSPTEVAELALFVAAHGRFTGEDVAMGGGAGLGG